MGLALATATLLSVGYLLVQPVPRDTWAPLDELIQAARMKGPAIALTVAALTGMAFCFRRVWLEWLALRPGRIEVETFSAGSALTDVDVEQLTLRFRQRLAELHLHAPASMPGALSEGDFLDVLGRSSADARNWLGSALGLLRAAKPPHAWQLRGVLVQRDAVEGYGLTVQVLRLPDSANPPETMWGSSWDEVVRRGADYATAAILPRTRRCTQQWAAWRRYRMHGRLLGNYEDGVSFEHRRRFDEALEAYYLAADDDPMNMALRLRIGLLQERMGLYLDALVTYQGMLVVGEERSIRGRTRERRLARHERRRSLLVARYRRIILLGGSELAKQWRKVGAAHPPDEPEPEPLRAARRRALRKRVEPLLREELEEVALRHPTVAFSKARKPWRARHGASGRTRLSDCSPATALCAPPGASGTAPDPMLFPLRELFALAALRDLRKLLWELRRHHRDRKLVLSGDSVLLTARCIEVRLDWIQYNLAGKQSHSWPPVSGELDKQVERIERLSPFNRWHEHYNAACVYALPLLAFDSTDENVVALSDELRNTLAKSAVERLASATANADSAYIAGRRDWLLSEDPDLDGLRAHNCFKEFEAMNFPARDGKPYRPLHVKTLESSRYVQGLMVDTARCWERTWHTRGRHLNGSPDVHELLGWWHDECEAWDHVCTVALNNRHWPARVDLLRSLQERADAYRFPAPEIAFPHYADKVLSNDELGTGEACRRTAADRAAGEAELRLHMIGRAVHRAKEERQGGPEADDIEHIKRWQAVLRRLDARGREPRRFLLAVLCDHHAALWQLLAEWVSAESDSERDEKEKAFKKQISDTELVWRGASMWWRTPALVRAAAHRGARPALLFGRYASDGHKATPVA